MTTRDFRLLLFSLFLLCACQSQNLKKSIKNSTQFPDATTEDPNFNYLIEVPENWIIRDSIIDGIKIRFLLPPQSLKVDYPAGNIIVAYMPENNIDDFVARNINNLKLNMSSVEILERGSIDSTGYNARWFTYQKTQHGTTRDMINYIIPSNGFAYMITFGTNKGSMSNYRNIFDKIARSFKN